MVDYQLYGRNKVVFDVKLSYFDIAQYLLGELSHVCYYRTDSD